MATSTERIVKKTEKYLAALKEDPGNIEYINQIIVINMPLVSAIVGKYKPYSEDRFQVGCIGLINAAHTFNPDKGVPFKGYASFCIERELHKAHKMTSDKHDVLDLASSEKVYLDDQTTFGNGDKGEMYESIIDDNAVRELENYASQEELTFICDTIIKPAIARVAERGNRNNNTKVNIEEWKKLEYVYILDLLSIESQKVRFNLTQFSKACGLSVTRVRGRHETVMDEIFQRMWQYMTLTFKEMFQRLRKGCTVPETLLCLDPGKTTGWCVFKNGELVEWGQLPECYDSDNIDIQPLMDLFETVKPDFILYEDYKVYGHKLERHTNNPVFTVRLIGCIETYSQMNKLPTHKQMATTAKGFCTDEKLKR